MTAVQSRVRTTFASTIPTIAMGWIAGMRSLSAPALVSDYLMRHRSRYRGHPLATPPVATALKLLALGEIIADKTPWVPDRTSWPSLVGRGLSGTAVGATLYATAKQPPVIGAVIGGTAAVLATFASYHVRTYLDQRFNLPDPLVAVLEDAIVIGGGIGVLRRWAP